MVHNEFIAILAAVLSEKASQILCNLVVTFFLKPWDECKITDDINKINVIGCPEAYNGKAKREEEKRRAREEKQKLEESRSESLRELAKEIGQKSSFSFLDYAAMLPGQIGFRVVTPHVLPNVVFGGIVLAGIKLWGMYSSGQKNTQLAGPKMSS